MTRGSGNGNEKGDVRVSGVVRVEAKTTMKKSFSVTLDLIKKLETVALSHGEVPVMVVEFLDGNGNPIREVAVMPTWVLAGLTDRP